MKLIYTFLTAGFLFSATAFAQNLPIGFAPGEEQLMPAYLQDVMSANGRAGIFTPPTGPVRTAAQWEESQALVITWTGFPAILREIVRGAQTQCKVIIHCSDSNAVKSNLNTHSVPLTNVKFIEVGFNSIWIRDYGANTCYVNDVDSLILVDWIYNRPRPLDDQLPVAYAELLNVPLYQTIVNPYAMVHTGGNFMPDGLGTFFSSKLVLDENEPGNPYYSPGKSEAEVDSMMRLYMGMERYVKMETLPYDGIHHIDMHMKLLDEKTLLVGQFPAGISDGPQMEANLQYVLSNYTNPWGDPYKVVRVPMPSSTGGGFPGGPFGNASYRTYSNFVIVNKTIIMPVYRQQFDTTAVRIIRENMPGYNIVTIDADNANGSGDLNQNIISQGGVIHCITHLVGVSDPLRIVHNNLSDTYVDNVPYQVDALIQHKSGIANASVFWTTDTTQAYNEVPMTLTNVTDDTWTGYIPAQPFGTTIFYYVGAEAVSGKQQVRPMTAPDGFWKFKVIGTTVGIEENLSNAFSSSLYPNPSKGITCIPFATERKLEGSLYVTDMTGKNMHTIYSGAFKQGEKNFFINTAAWSSGLYMVVLETNEGTVTQKLVVR